MQPLKIFIGYDHAESVAFHTMCSSIIRRASVPVSIVPIALSTLKDILPRERDPMQSNEFAFSRFLVPYLCNYEGRAVFMDCDMLIIDDIANLFALAVDDYAVQVVKHDHTPITDMKYLGQKQTQYPMKNWSSVMLFNNEKCKNLTPEYINKAPGLDLHQFKWLEGPHQIGDLPLEWNYLVDYYPHQRVDTLCNLHYTEGGPYFEDYRDCSYGKEWWEEYDYMRHCSGGTERTQHFSEVAEKVG